MLPRTIGPTIVGHLPKEVSRITYFILIRGATVSCRVLDVHHRRSPLIQGGLEIPIEISVEMQLTNENSVVIRKYEALVREQYKEPIDGVFEDATDVILKELMSSDEEQTETDSDFEDDV